MSLGDELRKGREAAGMTQEQVAFAAGIDRAYLSQLENDRKSPTVDTLVRICRALGLPASEVLARWERSEPPESGAADRPRPRRPAGGPAPPPTAPPSPRPDSPGKTP